MFQTLISETTGTSDMPKIQIDEELKARNAQRLAEAKERLGKHWVLHRESTFKVTYKDTPHKVNYTS